MVTGILILMGFGYLGYEVYRRATDPNHPKAFGQPDREAATAEAAPALPPGSRIDDLQQFGSRILYRVTLPDGDQQIHLLDPKTGKVQLLAGTASSPTMGQAAPVAP